MSRPLRIAHVITTISRGGAENQLAGLVRRQRADGHAVQVSYLKLEGWWRRALEDMGAEVVDLRSRGNFDPAACLRLRRALRAFKPDLLNAHMQPAELCARFALFGVPPADLPLVVTKHNLDPFCGLPGEAALGRWVARRASGLIAVSGSVLKLCERDGYLRVVPRSEVVYNAVDTEAFERGDPAAAAAARASWGAGPATLVVGTAARLLPLKAVDVLLEGFASWSRDSGRDARLVIVGIGAQEAELKALASKLGLDGKAFFLGFREDMPALMNAFDVFALNSDSEPFGLVLLEAMAAGKPVVATNAGGVPELVADKTEGLLIAPRRPEETAAALAALEDDALRARLGAAGRARVRALQGVEGMYRRTMEFYARCLP